MNEPAFPCQEWVDQATMRNPVFHQGMNLRDYFAAHAPEQPAWWAGGEQSIHNLIAWKWRYADAMLEARK